MQVNPISFPQYNPNSLVDQSQWSTLGNLGNVYREAQDRATLADLGKQFASGTLDEAGYRKAAGTLLGLGKGEVGVNMLKLAEARRLQDIQLGGSADLDKYLKTQSPGGTPVAAVEPDTPPPPARTPVPEIPGTVRTNQDGSIAGGITAPTIPAAPPVPPGPPLPQIAPAMPQPRPSEAGPAAVPASVALPPAPPQAPPPMQAPAALPPSVANANAGGAPASMAQGPQIEHVPYLMRLLPRLPESQQGVVAAAIKQAWDNAKPTTEIATLNALRDDPQLFEMATKLAAAKASQVNLHPGEKSYDTKMGETLAKIHGGFIEDLAKQPGRLANLDVAERSMGLKGFVTGAATPAVLAAKRALVALNIADPNDASPTELFQKLQNRTIMDAGGAASGLGPQISNNDVRIIQGSTQNTENSEAGNRMIIGFQRLMEKQKPLYLAELNRYAAAHEGRLDVNAMLHMAKWVEAHPLDYSSIPGFTPPPDLDALEKEMRRRNRLPPP